MLGDPRGNIKLFAGVAMALAFGAVGFLDDYIKVVKHRNLGLTARQKYLMQLVIGVFYLVMLYIAGDRSTAVAVPFLGTLELGLFYYPLAMIIITGFVNAVNLTDGLDGLSSSVTFVYAVVFLVIAAILQFGQASADRRRSRGRHASASSSGTSIPPRSSWGTPVPSFWAAWWWRWPSSVGLPLLLVFAGVVFWCEAFSVIIQVGYFKATHGKRLFKMSPIHHHFEMCGWSEVKIVSVFALVGLLGGALAVWSVLLL